MIKLNIPDESVPGGYYIRRPTLRFLEERQAQMAHLVGQIALPPGYSIAILDGAQLTYDAGQTTATDGFVYWERDGAGEVYRFEAPASPILGTIADCRCYLTQIEVFGDVLDGTGQNISAITEWVMRLAHKDRFQPGNDLETVDPANVFGGDALWFRFPDWIHASLNALDTAKASRAQGAWRKVGEPGNISFSAGVVPNISNVYYRVNQLGKVEFRGKAVFNTVSAFAGAILFNLLTDPNGADIKTTLTDELTVGQLLLIQDSSSDTRKPVMAALEGGLGPFALTSVSPDGLTFPITVFFDHIGWHLA